MRIFRLLILVLLFPSLVLADARLCSQFLCTGKQTIGTTAAEVGSSVNRYSLVITNLGSTAIDCGATDAVDATDGKTVAAGAVWTVASSYNSAITASTTIFCKTASSTTTIDYAEGRRP